MERIEIAEDGRIAAWVEAVERGDEVVIVREGKVVAEVKSTARPVFDLAKLEALHARLGPLAGMDGSTGAQLIREMRDADDH